MGSSLLFPSPNPSFSATIRGGGRRLWRSGGTRYTTLGHLRRGARRYGLGYNRFLRYIGSGCYLYQDPEIRDLVAWTRAVSRFITYSLLRRRSREIPTDPTALQIPSVHPIGTILARLLSELPQELKDLWQLRYLDGQPITLISDRMGIPVGSVKRLLVRANRLVRSTMDDALSSF